MSDFSSLVLIVGISFVATLVSSMCGGGSGLITTPVWIFLGFPLPVVIATNNINGSAWTLFAARTYLRGYEIDRRLLLGLISCGLVGAYCGAQVIIRADPKTVERIIGFLVLAIVLLTVCNRGFGVAPGCPRLRKSLTSLAALPLGFYEAFFGSGNGLFTSAMLTCTRGFVLLQALGYYYILAFFWCTFSAMVYIHGGHWNPALVVPSCIGSILGALVGSKIGARQGAPFIKGMFAVVGTLLGLKLLLGI
jgi:uncharacterized membrane protein YfcA